MTAVLLTCALAVTGGGLLMTSSATAGVYLACVGCLFAICARIAQAHAQHRQVLARLEPREPKA